MRAIFLNNKIQIHSSLCVSLCLSLLIFPIPWVLAWFAAALTHEFGHIWALKIFRVQIYRITIGFVGAYIETGYLSPCVEFITALSGPIAGVLLYFITIRFLPFLAVCGLIQSLYNLLPYPDYDGGRALNVIINIIMPPRAARLTYQAIILFISAALLFFGLYLWVELKLGPIALVSCMIPIIKSSTLKIPCKQR